MSYTFVYLCTEYIIAGLRILSAINHVAVGVTEASIRLCKEKKAYFRSFTTSTALTVNTVSDTLFLCAARL